MPQNDCKKYSDMIYEYTADMLSAEKERDLMRHVKSCSSCRNELERIRAVMGAASEIEDVPVPDELISALDTRLEQTGREIRNSRRQGYGNITGTVLSIAAAAALDDLGLLNGKKAGGKYREPAGLLGAQLRPCCRPEQPGAHRPDRGL